MRFCTNIWLQQDSERRRRMRRLVARCLLLLGASLSVLPSAYASLPEVKKLVELETYSPTWARNLEAALQTGLTEYKPVLALFSLPECGWCSRLKAELASPSLRAVLSSYVLVEVDASSLDVAMRYSIRGVPAIILFSGDGRTLGGFSGFLPAPELEPILGQYANFTPMDAEEDALAEERFSRLAAGTLQAEDWPGLMQQLGNPDDRERLQEAILDLTPYPADKLVELLHSSDLAVRIGAIELLEEHTGEDFGFDPWTPPLDTEAAAMRQRWEEWTANTNHSTTAESVYAPLTDSRITAYIQDVLGEDRARTARAMQMLEAGGHHAARQLAGFVQDHPDLAPGLRRRLREVQYAILLHGTSGHQASATAHQIVFGNLDTRIRTLSALPKTGAGIRAIPILQDLLNDENPLVREAACEAIISISGGAGTVLLKPFLTSETDINVTFSALRALGQTKSPRAVMALLPFLDHENEDLVIVTLEGLAKLKYTLLSKQLTPRLSDPRWRVRVAALEAIAELKIKSLREAVAAVIQDEDPFVQHAAISALAAISEPKEFKKGAAELFQAFPEQRPVILKAMAEYNLEIPADFITTIVQDPDSDRIIACLGTASVMEQRSLPLASRLISHPNPDIATAALGLIMKSGASQPIHRRYMINALQTHSGDTLTGLLEDLEIDADDFKPHALYFRHWLRPGTGPKAGSDPSTHPLQAIQDAFENAKAATASTPPPAQDRPSVEELVAAFETVSQSALPASTLRPASFPDLIYALEALTSHTEDRVAFLATIQLVRLGHAGLVPKLMETFSARTQSEHSQIAAALSQISSPAAKAANITLLSNAAEDIRKTASGNLINNFKGDGFAAVVDEWLRPDTPFHASEVYLAYRMDDIPFSANREQSARLLASGQTPLITLGILLHAFAWEKGDTERLIPYTRSDNPYIRSAAFRILSKQDPQTFLSHLPTGAQDPDSFQALLPTAVQDPSPVVRTAIAHGFMLSTSSEKVFLSKEEAITLSLNEGNRNAAPPLKPKEREALHTLSRDPHAPARFQALLALLSRGETIDAERLASALDALPDSSRAASEVISTLYSYGDTKTRPELKVLGASIRSHVTDSYYQSRINKIFGPAMTEEELLAVNILTRFDSTNTPTLITLELPSVSEAAVLPPPTLLYFYQPGCKECRQVKDLLQSMPDYFQNIQIHSLNVRHRDAALLNEALCDHFGVPDQARLVAPALFAADGALIGEAIHFDSLTDLLSRSASREDGEWFSPGQDVLEQAEKSIQTRYSETIKTGVIMLIALADGINPCAFATIIFLLSYLHIARRNPRQLLQVGIAFILGVFLAYFAMGIGLVTLLDRLTFLTGLSRIVNYAMAVFVLLIALLSLRDGILCLRGRMGDMTLQLPGQLKQQIHSVIRLGARHRRYVIAAFVIGILISIIELPCTGQAYLPTIAYMVRDTDLRGHALLHLLLYNIFFIVPLIVIFILAAFGMTHERLTASFQKHAAAVKFVTAALFFLLFAVFLFTL